MARVLLLGASGALGSMVYDYFKYHTNHTVFVSVRNRNILPSILNDGVTHILDVLTGDVADLIKDCQPEYIINCIGIINKPLCHQDDPKCVVASIRVNALFPYQLLEAAGSQGSRIIQIATDCVFNGERGGFSEHSIHDALDIYAKTKSLGEVHDKQFLNIRCSFIGPEISKQISLLGWFLNQPQGATVSGYAHHRWNGVTSLQFAQLCDKIATRGASYFDALTSTSYVHHYIPNTAVTKYELISGFADVFRKDITILKTDSVGSPVDRTLSTEYAELLDTSAQNALPIPRALEELKEYMAHSPMYGRGIVG